MPLWVTINEFVERAVQRTKCLTEGTLLTEMAMEFNSNDVCISQTIR